MIVTLAIHLLDEETEAATSRCVLAHGFTQNAACLRPFAEHLRDALVHRDTNWPIAMIDAPGHGHSQHDNADLIDAASLLVEAGGAGHYVGYSMGGRMLLHAALLYPDRVQSLTLIGATAGIEGASERATRLNSDELLAARLERDGVERFVDQWLQLELFATLPAAAAMRAERLMNRTEGLAASLRHCGAGNQFPLWSQLHRIEIPTQIIAGRDDAKFMALGQRMSEELPNARFAAVQGGHAVHSEQPHDVAELVANFMTDVDAAARLDGS